MTEIPIRNMHSRKAVPPGFCDLIIEGNDVKLRKKEGNSFIKGKECTASGPVTIRGADPGHIRARKLPQPAPQDARSQLRNYPNVTMPQQEKGSSARYTGIVPLFLLPKESE